jgi:hypothetical protein
MASWIEIPWKFFLQSPTNREREREEAMRGEELKGLGDVLAMRKRRGLPANTTERDKAEEGAVLLMSRRVSLDVLADPRAALINPS